MRKLRFFLAVAFCVAVLLPALSYAQAGSPFDHLKCYKIKDPQTKAQYTADLVPQQMPPFDIETGCVIGVPAKLFCIPVQKTNVKPTAPQSVNGKDAQDYLLYKIKCPKLATAVVIKGGMPLDVTDQFGARTILVGKHQLLLVPAFKMNNLCHSQTDPTASTCAGDCEDPNQKCVQVPGTTDCRCESPCGLDATGQCDGICPDSTQKCEFVQIGGAVRCSCTPPVDGCHIDAAGVCGGPCPNPDEKCVADSAAGICRCEKPCGFTGIRMCGGLCPNPSEFCLVKPDDSGCECRRTSQPCGPDATGKCAGDCPDNLPCVQGGPSGCICG